MKADRGTAHATEDGLLTGRQADTLPSLLLAGLLVLAALLRLYRLDAGLWFDEILSYVNYFRAPLAEIASTYDSQNQHLLYSLLARISLVVFGDHGWAVRLPAVIFGVASIWAVYLLAREVAGRREALLCAALLTLSYHHIWFSQNARGYTGLLFWTLISSFLLLRALKCNSKTTWILFACTIAMGLYTHLTMVFVLLGHFTVYVLKLTTARQRDMWWTGLVFGFGLGAVLTVLLYSPVLSQVLGGLTGEKSNVDLWSQPLWTLQQLLQGLRLTFGRSIAGVAALLVVGAGLISFVRKELAIVLLLVMPSVTGALVTILMDHVLWPRFFFFALGFGVIVIVRGAMVLGGLVGRTLGMTEARSALLGPALCLALIFVSALSVPSAYGPKQDYAGALSFIQANREPTDAVVAVGLATFPYDRYYQTDWQWAGTVEQLDSIRTTAGRTWVVYTLPVHLQGEHPELMSAIQQDFSLVKEYPGTLSGGSIFVYLSEKSRGR